MALLFVWYAEVSDDRKATDFTIEEGSTENSYKLTKSRERLFNKGTETAYFSVSGEKYVASLGISIDNDWYIISADQGCLYRIYFPLH